MNSFSFLSHLECSLCHRQFDAGVVQTFCPDCQSPLLARYDFARARKSLDRDAFLNPRDNMWFAHALLPIVNKADVITLGEGNTPNLSLPNLASKLGLQTLSMKDEGRNPTHSFKARGLSCAVSKARELGITKFAIPTAGNAGAALAAYCAHAGLNAAVFAPKDTPASILQSCRAYGAEVVLVDGLISDAARLVRERAAEGWFDMSTFKEPYRLEGKKVMGFEIAASYKDQLPDVILYPTGGGTGFVGIWKAFQELIELGWMDGSHLPRMVAVQSEGCAPVVKAWEDQVERCEFWQGASTIAGGLRVPLSFADRLILKTLTDSHGAAISVSDEAIRDSFHEAAQLEGVSMCLEGAACIAGLKKMLQAGSISASDSILILNTGSGLTSLDMLY